jgi:hypothetical protein
MATSSGRCYLLELPPELRVIIYNFCFDYHSKPPKVARRNEAAEIAAQYLIKDCARLLKQSALLHTTRHITQEALPIYQKALQSKIGLLKAAFDEFGHFKADLFNMMFCPGPVELANKLPSTIKSMARRLAKCKRMEKKISRIAKRDRGWSKAM